MSLMNIAVPIVAALVEILRSRKEEVAKQTGVSKEAVGQVGDLLEQYLTRDERAMQVVMAEIEKARQHDAATLSAVPIVELLRGLVRPVITLTAFAWYVLARVQGVTLTPEDYALIGGIVAFWFGFRTFEKRG